MSDETAKPNGKNGAPKLLYGRMHEASQRRRELCFDIPAGTDPETLLDPGYWVHYTRDIRPGDILEPFCEDGSWEASYRVMFVSRDGIRLSQRSLVRHDTADPKDEQTDTHRVKWISPPNKYGVIRVRDNVVVRDGLYPKDQAIAFLRTLGA